MQVSTSVSNRSAESSKGVGVFPTGGHGDRRRGTVPVGAGLYCKVDGEPSAGVYRSTYRFRGGFDLWICRAVDFAAFGGIPIRRLERLWPRGDS